MNQIRLGVVVALALLIYRLAEAGEAGHDFAKWEPEISAFEQMDGTNPPPKGGLLFTGSSTIRLWKTLALDFPGQNVINRGFGGSQIVDATHFADRVIFPYEPRMVLLRAGGNDLWAGKSPDQVFEDFKAFVATVRSKLPKTTIVFISLSPSIARWQQADKEKAVNAKIEGFIRKTPNTRFLDTWSIPLGSDGQPREDLFLPDKLHFNAEGYKLLVERVRPYLAK